MRKEIVNVSFVVFSCFFILFAACIANTLSAEPTLYDLFLSESETVALEIRLKSGAQPKTYGELYEFLSETENVRLLKKTGAQAVNEVVLYAPRGFKKRSRLSEICSRLNNGEQLLLNTSYKRFLTDGKLLLEGRLREVDGYFYCPNSGDYPCVADMSIFRGSGREIDYDTFYIQYDGSYAELSALIGDFFGGGSYETAVSEAGKVGGFESADLLIVIGSFLAAAALSFNLSVFIKLWLSENRKVFFCKYLCGCDMAQIQKETLAEFALNLAAGTAAAFTVFLLLKAIALPFRFGLSGFFAACIVCNFLLVTVYLLTAHKEFPKADSLVIRRAN